MSVSSNVQEKYVKRDNRVFRKIVSTNSKREICTENNFSGKRKILIALPYKAELEILIGSKKQSRDRSKNNSEDYRVQVKLKIMKKSFYVYYQSIYVQWNILHISRTIKLYNIVCNFLFSPLVLSFILLIHYFYQGHRYYSFVPFRNV